MSSSRPDGGPGDRGTAAGQAPQGVPDPAQHRHRNIQGGIARASVFGASDGLVSNVSLILGVAGADPGASYVRLAGIAGLLAGAFSMAAGEYVSMKAQSELLERELELERRMHEHFPEFETEELAELYESQGVDPETAQAVASDLMADPELALEVHAREELGIDPDELGSPVGAAVGSFVAFCLGALVPLLPWFFAEGNGAVVGSVVVSAVAAAGIGAALAYFTGRNVLYSAARQVAIAAAAAGVTYAVGTLVGTEV